MIGSGPEDPPVTMTVKCLEFFTLTVIVTVNGPIFQAILDDIADIGRYPAILGLFWAISSNIRVTFSSVKSIICRVRSE